MPPTNPIRVMATAPGWPMISSLALAISESAYLSKTESSLRIEDGRVRGVGTRAGRNLRTRRGGRHRPLDRPLFQKAGLDLPIETEYHQVAILKNAPDMKGGGCACIDSVTRNLLPLRCS